MMAVPTDDRGKAPLNGEPDGPAEFGGDRDPNEPVVVADSLRVLRQSAVAMWAEYGRYVVWASAGAALGALVMTLYVLSWSIASGVDVFSNLLAEGSDWAGAIDWLAAGYGAFIGASLGLLLARLVKP